MSVSSSSGRDCATDAEAADGDASDLDAPDGDATDRDAVDGDGGLSASSSSSSSSISAYTTNLAVILSESEISFSKSFV